MPLLSSTDNLLQDDRSYTYEVAAEYHEYPQRYSQLAVATTVLHYATYIVSSQYRNNLGVYSTQQNPYSISLLLDTVTTQ